MTRRRTVRTTAVAWVAAVAIVVGIVSVGILKVLPDCWRSHPTWSVGQCLSELVSPAGPLEPPRPPPAKPLTQLPQLTVSWTDNSGGVATTRVERRLSSETVYTAYVDVPPGVTSYVDTTVSAGTAYCYRAMAYDNDGSSPYSPEACGTPAADAGALSVSVTKAGTGSGTVSSAPAGIDCGTACSASYAGGTSVILSATAASGSAFTGWTGGGCSGTAPCTVAGNTAVTLTATFGVVSAPAPPPSTYTLTVTRSGPGQVSGTGIKCGSDCTESFAGGTVVTLAAVPNKNAVFAGWSGPCTGTGACTLTLASNTTIGAAFRRK